MKDPDKRIIELKERSGNLKPKMHRKGIVKMTEKEKMFLWIMLLEQEVEALRSVLSEFDGDQGEYLQMQKANHIDAVKNSLVRPSL